jgi:glutamine cyclotransferase
MMRASRAFGLLTVAAGLVLACANRSPAQSGPRTAVYGYRIVHTYPHDSEAFTQGLVYRDGSLYESTGLNGRSSLRKVRLETGEVLQKRDVDTRYFAEGLTDWNGRLVQLTWQTNVAFVYDLLSFAPEQTFSYQGEGWGLTHDAARLILSDGSSTLRFFDPQTYREIGHVNVRDEAGPIERLNELELVGGEVFANVWQTDRICRIDPSTGRITGWIDLSGLLGPDERREADVLNGIAYDAAGGRLFVTGKLWPHLFEIALERRNLTAGPRACVSFSGSRWLPRAR